MPYVGVSLLVSRAYARELFDGGTCSSFPGVSAIIRSSSPAPRAFSRCENPLSSSEWHVAEFGTVANDTNDLIWPS